MTTDEPDRLRACSASRGGPTRAPSARAGQQPGDHPGDTGIGPAQRPHPGAGLPQRRRRAGAVADRRLPAVERRRLGGRGLDRHRRAGRRRHRAPLLPGRHPLPGGLLRRHERGVRRTRTAHPDEPAPLLVPATVKDGSTGVLTLAWAAEDGQPVDGPVTVYSRTGTTWTRLASLTTQDGVARLRTTQRSSTTYEVRAGAGSWWDAPAAVQRSIRTVPPGTVVVRPAGAPAPTVRVAAQPRVATGAAARVTPVSSRIWRAMAEVLAQRLPVGRSGLRTLRVTYWGFDGYRHRGELVVARGSAGQRSRRRTWLRAGRRGPRWSSGRYGRRPPRRGGGCRGPRRSARTTRGRR